MRKLAEERVNLPVSCDSFEIALEPYYSDLQQFLSPQMYLQILQHRILCTALTLQTIKQLPTFLPSITTVMYNRTAYARSNAPLYFQQGRSIKVEKNSKSMQFSREQFAFNYSGYKFIVQMYCLMFLFSANEQHFATYGT